ncbi:unnamed protein product [marine sediment metagenome]|uniref:Uncharacterized protein n=1 Tax=marine sediment metagenome TaxID=412755 RepID=X1PYI8_9ZZZZ
MPTEILRPNAAGDYTNIAYQFPVESEHWDKVDEESPDDDTTYVYTPSAVQQKDAYGLQATAIPDGSTINSVMAYLRIRGLAQPFLRLAGVETEGAKVGNESPNYGGTIYAIAIDDTHIYVGGYATQTVRKYLKSDLSYIDETPSYGGTIRAIAIDDTHIYVGGYATQTVRKYLKSDLSYIDETPSYGGTIRAMVIDDTHIYVGGYTTRTVRKYLKSDLSYIDETPSYGDDIRAIAIDDTHIYVGGDTTRTVRKYLKSDLSYIDQTASYGGDIYAVAIDDTHIYAGGAATRTVRKYLKSDLSYVGQTPSYGGTISAMVIDDTYIYAGGTTYQSVCKYLKLDLSHWLTFSEVLAKPGGGAWAVADLNNLQVAIGLEVPNPPNNAYCTQDYVEVDYTPVIGQPYIKRVQAIAGMRTMGVNQVG